MKYVFYLLLFALLGFTIQSCKDDEGQRPEIRFKTGTGYTSSDATVAVGDTLLIGIHAEKTEDVVLDHFNVSSSTDGGANISLDDVDLTGAEEDAFEVDYQFTVPQAGHTYKLTFTVTNRDGLTNHVDLTLTSI